MKGKILVAKWGYSMILSTWVRVIKESTKTLLVEEVKGRSLTTEELAQHKLSPGFLQSYTVATDKLTGHNGLLAVPFRLYKRDVKLSGVDTIWIGHPKTMSSKLIFTIWDGQPEYENHCD